MDDLTLLPDGLREPVRMTLTAIERGLGEKLRSVLWAGSAEPASWPGAVRHVELLVVARDLPVPALSNLAHQLGAVGCSEVRVRVLTERELLRSADVFTLQLVDYQSRGVVLIGDDPLADLHFTRGELRRSIEQTLRLLGWRIRDAVLQGARWDGPPGLDAACLLRASWAELLVIARHVLRLLGETPAELPAPLAARLAERVGASSPAPLATLVQIMRGEQVSADAVAPLADLLALVDAVIGLVDGLGTGD